MSYPRLFEPTMIGPLELRNRIMMTMHGGLNAERNVRYYEARAAGGVGLMCVPGGSVGVNDFAAAPGRFAAERVNEVGAVAADPSTTEGIAFYDNRIIAPLRALADAGHRHGAVVITQIYHLGGGRASGPSDLRPTLAPSALRDDEDRTVPHALDEEEIGKLVLAYGHSARRAREAGLDGVELHAAHGYLLNQFISPYTNHRIDAYGGSAENRRRIIAEILATIDELAGADYPVGLRINATEWIEDGLQTDEAIDVVNAFASRLMYANVTSGNTTGLKHGVTVAYASPWLVEEGHNVRLAAEVRKAVPVPVIVAGRVLTPEQAEQLIIDGACDVVGMARALIADPDWPTKARAGRPEAIRPCISNNDCHGRGHMMCAVNPVSTREEELTLVPAPRSRNVLVIGGGPAGTEAARVAALRGHRVVLHEASEFLGGQVRVMAQDPGRSRVRDWLAFQEREVRAAGVDVRLASVVGAAELAAASADVVVLATGGRPALPSFAGADAGHVVLIDDVLLGTATLGARVAVVAGLEDHLRPVTLADLLRSRGHDVVLISETVNVGQGIERRTLHQLLKRLLTNDVRLSPMTAVTGFADGVLRTRQVITGRDGEIGPVDSVVVACGSDAVDELRAPLRASGAEFHLVGDCLSPRQIINAILDGARVGHAV
jgi:2,4-dienoyl-CoA reductase-like NADH-dependent reductase (Old Yellow Enzyme family)